MDRMIFLCLDFKIQLTTNRSRLLLQRNYEIETQLRLTQSPFYTLFYPDRNMRGKGVTWK